MTTSPRSGALAHLAHLAQALASTAATLGLLADPSGRERLRRAQAEVDAGDAVGGDDLRAMLATLREQ